MLPVPALSCARHHTPIHIPSDSSAWHLRGYGQIAIGCRLERPKPNRRKPRIFFEARSISPFEYCAQSLTRQQPPILPLGIPSAQLSLRSLSRPRRTAKKSLGPAPGRRKWHLLRRHPPRQGVAATAWIRGVTRPVRRASRRPYPRGRSYRYSHADGRRYGRRTSLAWPIAAIRASRSVSIGHEPVMTHPASITAFKMASHLAVVLLAKTIIPIPPGATTRRASPNGFVSSRS